MDARSTCTSWGLGNQANLLSTQQRTAKPITPDLGSDKKQKEGIDERDQECARV